MLFHSSALYTQAFNLRAWTLKHDYNVLMILAIYPLHDGIHVEQLQQAQAIYQATFKRSLIIQEFKLLIRVYQVGVCYHVSDER